MLSWVLLIFLVRSILFFVLPCRGAQFVLFCSVDSFLCILFYCLLIRSFRVFCPRGLSALHPSLVRLFESTCDWLRVCSSCCAQYWFVLLAYSMLWQSFFWESASSPRGHRRTASSVWRAAHCTVHREQPPLRRHQPVSTFVETSGSCYRGSRLIYQQVSLSPPGGASARSAPVPQCGLALQSRLTVLASMSAPSFDSRRVSSPKGVDQCLVRGKTLFRNFPWPRLCIL